MEILDKCSHSKDILIGDNVLNENANTPKSTKSISKYFVNEVKSFKEIGSNLEWIERKNTQGNEILVNVRTGMSIFQKQVTDNSFSITTRNNIMPKGMSPIMLATSKPSQELTPISKNILYETMAKCGTDNDINTVKWLKYFKDKGNTRSFLSSSDKKSGKKFNYTR